MGTAASVRRYAICLAVMLLVIAGAYELYPRRAYADGIWQEQIQASIGNRAATLFIKINPPVLVAGTDQDAYLQLRLFDAKTNNNINGTTFELTVTKGVTNDAKRLLQDTFATDSGLLTLHIAPMPGEVQINGNDDPFMPGYMADPGGNVKISGPLLLDGGIYHLHIKIVTVDDIRTLLNDTTAPQFDSYLSIGDIASTTVAVGGQQANSTLVSYYDKTSGFSLNPENRTFTWRMPFDWNASRIAKAASFIVHEEVRIPANLTSQWHANSFNATLNGHQSVGKIIVDPFTYKTAFVVHYFLGKSDVVNLLADDKSLSSAKQMQFTLFPQGFQADNETSGIWQGESRAAIVTWSPGQLSSGTTEQAKIQFIDSEGKKIAADVSYALTVKDLQGNTVISKTGLVAVNGTDTQNLSFPSNQIYRIEASISAVNYPNSAPDLRKDFARGVVVVPEFPAGSIIAISGIIGFAVILQRLANRR